MLKSSERSHDTNVGNKVIFASTLIMILSLYTLLTFRVIFALGISMTFINIPVEWFSVGFDWTWMLLFGDIRQGIFYAMLLSFWIIFCGEHLMVSNFSFLSKQQKTEGVFELLTELLELIAILKSLLL